MAVLKKLCIQYKELILYGIFGVLTTIVNIIVFYLLDIAHVNIYISNTCAFIISVIFAYVTNKLFVFESKSWKKNIVIKESISFLSARIFSYFLDMGTIYLLVDILKKNKLISKIIANIIVIIVNYIVSKMLIFRKKEKNAF